MFYSTHRQPVTPLRSLIIIILTAFAAALFSLPTLAADKDRVPLLLNEATELARTVSNKNGEALALAAIARIQRSPALFAEAIEAAMNIPDDESAKFFALSIIAEQQAMAGLYGDAARTALQLDREWGKADALNSIAGAQALNEMREQIRAGLFDEAIATVDDIQGDGGLSDALAKGIEGRGLDIGPPSLTNAISETRSSAGSKERNEGFAKIASAQALAGLFDEAHTTAELITDDEIKSGAFLNILRTQIKAESLENTGETTQRLIDIIQESPSQNILLNVYEALAYVAKATGKDSEMTSLIVNASSSFGEDAAAFKVAMLSRVAEVQENSALFDQATQTVRSIDDSFQRSIILASVAERQRNQSLFAEAVALAHRIEGQMT